MPKLRQPGLERSLLALNDPEIERADVEATLSLYNEPDVHRYGGGHFFRQDGQKNYRKVINVLSRPIKPV